MHQSAIYFYLDYKKEPWMGLAVWKNCGFTHPSSVLKKHLKFTGSIKKNGNLK